LPQESYITRRRRQDEARQEQIRKDEQAAHEKWLHQQELDRKRRQEESEAKRLAVEEQRRKITVEKTTKLFLQKPYDMAPKTYIAEFHQALLNLSRYASEEWQGPSPTMSKLISTCYEQPICHPKLSLQPVYREMLTHLHEVIDSTGFAGLPYQTESPSAWPLIEILFSHIGYTNVELEPLRDAFK